MSLRDKIEEANQIAVGRIIQSDPVWIDIREAGQVIDGLEDHMILHSGPPVPYADMCALHRRGMISGVLFEGWADNPEEADQLLSGGISASKALWITIRWEPAPALSPNRLP